MNKIKKESFLYEQLRYYLLELIAGNLGADYYRLPTEETLTGMFNISRITVRKAFDSLVEDGFLERYKGRGTFISKDIDKQKLESARLADSTKPAITKVGVILPSINSDHTPSILNNIHKYFVDNNINDAAVLYATTEQSQEREERAIQNFLKFGVDGIILYPVDGEIYNHILLKLSLDNFPLVLIDRILPGLDFNFVTSDNESASVEAVDYLLDRGHRDIAVFSGYHVMSSTVIDRIKGYEEGLKKNNILINSKHEIIAAKGESFDSVSMRMRELLLSGTVTAVYAVCPTSSVLLLRVLRALEKESPGTLQKVSVIYTGFEQNTREFTSPRPTTMLQNSDLIGYEAITLLNKILQKPESKKSVIKIPCTLDEGETVYRIGPGLKSGK